MRVEDIKSRGLKKRKVEAKTALPRTDLLEAKDKGVIVLQKKVFKIFFQAISKRGKQKRSSQIFREVLGVSYIINEQIPTIVETEANAHHTIWGSFDINLRGASRAKLTQGAALKRNGASLS